MPRQILIVDDNAINRQLLINTLQNDYDILEAENGREALSLMHRKYKVLSAVLLDIMMPEMNGYEFLQSVRENALLSQIPVIMVTASDDENARVKALSLGANDFIIKPFNPDIVRHCLRNNIELRETASILNAIQKDKLTTLYNRETFFEKVSAMIKDKEPGYYLLSCFDIDNFKIINDQFGAAEGDRILRDVGHAVKSNMNNIGGIAGRISADNFAALFPAEKHNTDVLQKIQDKKLVTLENKSVIFSIGRYIITDLSLAASAIYDRAYIAKQSIKGRYDKHLAYFDEIMLENLIRDQQIIGEMETALAENQFQVWFQPQYNHVSGELTGAEALVRWRHPQKGIIPPGEFIPLFEQNGFIYELDKYVWEEVCLFLRKWIDDGLTPIKVSVNISRYDIFRSDFVDVITGLIRKYNIPINLLHLEITESAFTNSIKTIIDIVKKLVNLGFVVEIDDFGSGYSSLNTLKSVPAQVLKLDMRFLEDNDDASRGGNILQSIVRMTKWLGMSVIAEGVETKEQGDFLKSIGCSHVQGFLYAHPMPAAAYKSHCNIARKESGFIVLETADNLNNDQFWNPQSIDTLIFNSYVGAACIYEYHNGNIELLRATDKYAKMLGGENMTVEKLLKLNLMNYLDLKSSAEAIDSMNASVQSKGESYGEFVFLDMPECAPEIHLRSTMRVIASADDRYLVYCISENITAQRISENKERIIAQQLQVVMDNISCGITAVTINSNGRVEFLFENNRYYELLGYTKKQYENEIGSQAFDVVYPDDRRAVINITEKTYDSGQPTALEYRAVRRDGSVIWLRSLLSMTEFEWAAGRVQLCTYADITAEKNLAQMLLDNLPCGAGICSIDKSDARMIYLNKRYFTYFKHRSELDRSTSVFSVIHPDDRATLRAAMRPAYESGATGSCIIRIMDGPDEYIPFHLSGVSTKPDEKSSDIYVTFVPISDEELSFSETLSVALATMMASSTDLAFVKDVNLHYICCSRAFAHMAGLRSEKDVVGKTDYDLFDKTFADQYVADDRRVIESRKSIIDLVERIPSDDGKIRYSSTSKYLLNDSFGKTVGIYGIGRDITQTREVEMRQKFLINSMPGGVAVYEGLFSAPDKIKLTYFSDGYCKLFGFSREEYEEISRNNPLSLVLESYIPELVAQIQALIQSNMPIDYIYRARTKDGGYRWIHIKAVCGERNDDKIAVNALLFDVTVRQEALEHLRVSEEENRLAIRHSGNIVCRYDIAAKTLSVPPSFDAVFEMPPISENVPLSQVQAGKISPETTEAYLNFYDNIQNGKKCGTLTYQRMSTLGWRWIEVHSSTIFSGDDKPVTAIISFVDATESYEKDAAYKKWRQSFQNKEPETYSLFRCNISKESVADSVEGTLLDFSFSTESSSFARNVTEYVSKWVWEDDADRFTSFLNINSLKEKFFNKDSMISLEYREKQSDGGYRWLRLSVDMVEHIHSSDIEAHLFFEDIDEAKRSELLTLALAQNDSLTGLLNRMTFTEKVDSLIQAAKTSTQHALIMLDIDDFKLVNDAFGHGIGDQTLVDISNLLRANLRREDLVGRLGGDEFVVFLNDIPGEKIIAEKARQICELSRKSFNSEVQISGSVGIAVYPRDGTSFSDLYKKADDTLYYVKGSGRNNYAFYHDDMKDEYLKPASPPQKDGIKRKRCRMLIVDDNNLDYEMLANIFRSEFIIEKAKDGSTALTRLRHYGSAISVVLLDILMPEMDGFAVLEKMQQNPEMRSIPVVVVTGDENRETNLKAIRGGASDFVMKPVDPEILRIRVFSAISKAENERLHAKNSFLKQQNSEIIRYKTVLEKIGLVVIEFDYNNDTFVYCPSISKYLAGRYDNRSLWHILLSDSVADTQTVMAMQEFVCNAAEDKGLTEAKTELELKTASGEMHRFILDIYKLSDKNGLTGRLLLVLQDTDVK